MKKQPTQKERIESHSVKMEMKEALREARARSLGPVFIFANISKNHKDYGETPNENAKRMREKSS